MHITRAFFTAIIPDADWYGPDFAQPPRCVADSRLLEKGDIFIAIKGKRDDGHAYLEQALASGAGGFIIEKSAYAVHKDFVERVKQNSTVIVVDDVYGSLVRVAHAWRMRYAIPIVGVTGSVGKTSTKELLGAIVRCAGKTFLSTQGNHNTLLGCAMTLLQLTDEHEGAIIEMGINKPGEMALLADLVRPTIAVITRSGHGHLEGLGSCATVAVEKRMIFKYFTHDSVGIIPGDQPEVSSVSYPHLVVRFGKKIAHQVQLRKVVLEDQHIRAILKIYGTAYNVVIPTVQQSYLNNILAAVSVAHILGIDHAIICKVIQEPLVIARRFERHALAGARGILIDDAYNANPESMKAALLAFDRVSEASIKIAVLGDMLELGPQSRFWHRQLGRFLRKTPSVSHVVLVGPSAALMRDTIPSTITAVYAPSWKEAVSQVHQMVQSLPADEKVAILLKASRGLMLYRMIDYVVHGTTLEL